MAMNKSQSQSKNENENENEDSWKVNSGNNWLFVFGVFFISPRYCLDSIVEVSGVKKSYSIS